MEGVLTLKLDAGVLRAMFVEFAQDMFPGFSTADVGVWPADEGELVVSVLGARASTPSHNSLIRRPLTRR